jgi:hypothetical protein
VRDGRSSIDFKQKREKVKEEARKASTEHLLKLASEQDRCGPGGTSSP